MISIMPIYVESDNGVRISKQPADGREILNIGLLGADSKVDEVVRPYLNPKEPYFRSKRIDPDRDVFSLIPAHEVGATRRIGDDPQWTPVTAEHNLYMLAVKRAAR